jgi:hypothetical protein
MTCALIYDDGGRKTFKLVVKTCQQDALDLKFTSIKLTF